MTEATNRILAGKVSLPRLTPSNGLVEQAQPDDHRHEQHGGGEREQGQQERGPPQRSQRVKP